jgi:hypothetical protein
MRGAGVIEPVGPSLASIAVSMGPLIRRCLLQIQALPDLVNQRKTSTDPNYQVSFPVDFFL